MPLLLRPSQVDEFFAGMADRAATVTALDLHLCVVLRIDPPGSASGWVVGGLALEASLSALPETAAAALRTLPSHGATAARPQPPAAVPAAAVAGGGGAPGLVNGLANGLAVRRAVGAEIATYMG